MQIKQGIIGVFLLGILAACAHQAGSSRAAKKNEGIFLGDLEPVMAKVGWGDYLPNYYPEDDRAPVLVDGVKCNAYIFAHAKSEALYTLPPDVTKFTAIGIRPAGNRWIAGTFAFEVLIDGKSVFKSEPLRSYPDFQAPISVDIPKGSQTLGLKVDNLGNGFSDHSIWAYPYLN
jgi:hypothetical protein